MYQRPYCVVNVLVSHRLNWDICSVLSNDAGYEQHVHGASHYVHLPALVRHEDKRDEGHGQDGCAKVYEVFIDAVEKDYKVDQYYNER